MREALTLPDATMQKAQILRGVSNAEAATEEVVHLILSRCQSPAEIVEVITFIEPMRSITLAAEFLDEHARGNLIMTPERPGHNCSLQRVREVLDRLEAMTMEEVTAWAEEKGAA